MGFNFSPLSVNDIMKLLNQKDGILIIPNKRNYKYIKKDGNILEFHTHYNSLNINIKQLIDSIHGYDNLNVLPIIENCDHVNKNQEINKINNNSLDNYYIHFLILLVVIIYYLILTC